MLYRPNAPSIIFHQFCMCSCARVPVRFHSIRPFAIQVSAYRCAITEHIQALQNPLYTNIEHVILCFWLFLHTFFFLFRYIMCHWFGILWMKFNDFESNRNETLYCSMTSKRENEKKNILPACVYNRSSTRFSVIFIHFFLLFGIFGQAHLVLPRCHYHLLISIDSCVKEFVQLYYHLMMCAWMKIPTTSK